MLSPRFSLQELQKWAKTESPVSFDLVRHGATMFNGEAGVSVDRERGWSNVPLTEEGRQEALAAGLKLKGRHITVVKSSDLNRAQETADIVGEVIHIKPQFDARLRPWKMGSLTEKDMRDVIPKLRAYAKVRPDTPVEGGGESFNEFRLRAFEGISAAIAGSPGRVLLVVHTRIERLLAGWKAKGYPIEHSIDIDVFLQPGDPPGGVVEFKTHRQLLNGELSEKLTHYEAEYGPGHCDEFCKTCRFSDHQSPPSCSWVSDIQKRGYCRFWTKA
jgi:broad specificity phosphatase PhoE